MTEEVSYPKPGRQNPSGSSSLLQSIALLAFIYFVYFVFASNPWVPPDVDATGYVSHTVESTITAQSNWMRGESKNCSSAPLNADTAVALGKPPGYAFSLVHCDDGPEHSIPVTFWGAEDQSGRTVAFWTCTRESDSFVCKQTGAY